MKKVLAILGALAVLLTGCAQPEQGESHSSAAAQTVPTSQTVPASQAGEMLSSPTFTDRDLSGEYDPSGAVKIVLTGAGAEISGTGAAVTDGGVTITAGGTYLLSGSGTGMISVDAGDADKVQLVLDGVTVANGDGPAVYIRSADKVFLTLAQGSQNSLSDGSGYAYTDGDTNVDAALFSRADLTINGSGALTVTGNEKHGIVSKDDLVITGGELTVTAQKAGITGKDCVKLCQCAVTVTAGTDGIRSDNDEDPDRGYVYVESGSLTIAAGNDGIQAETELQIRGGTVSVTSGGGSGGTVTGDESAKGLKAGTALAISGGEIRVDAADDGIHTNGDAFVSGGAVCVSSADDGIHADGTLAISGGAMEITRSYEGLEAASVQISGGTVRLTASDDGINASSGSGSAAPFGRGGGFGGFGGFGDDGSEILISGGYVLVDAQGDGIDSNGSVTVSGGVTLVSGPTGSGDGALDYGGSATVTGGVFVALGSMGMVQNFTQAENQGAILCTMNSQSGGTSFALCGADGTVLVSFTPEKAYASAVVSCPGIQTGGTYTIVTGGTVAGADDNGYAENSSVSGGTQAAVIEMTANLYSAGGMGGQSGGGRGDHGMGGFGGKMPPTDMEPSEGTAPTGDLQPLPPGGQGM